MCVEYIINGKEVGCIQDVIDECGGVCFMDGCYPANMPPSRSECLCSVDIKATAKMFGFTTYEPDDDWYPLGLRKEVKP